jgi:hypothetical protein
MQVTPFERRWLVAIFDAIYPGAAVDTMPIGAGEAQLEPFVDDLFVHVPFQPALGIRIATWVILLCPLFVIGRPRTFVGLDQDDRERVLTRLAESRLWFVRELPALLKMVGALGYCALPAVQRQVGIPLVAAEPSWVDGATTPLADLRGQNAILHADAASALAPAGNGPRAANGAHELDPAPGAATSTVSESTESMALDGAAEANA